MRLTRRKFAIVSGAALTAAGIPWARAAGPPDKIRIGYAISLNGPFTQAAAITTLPNYKLWIHDVNERGGIMVKQYGKRLPIDVVEYDDGSSQENAIRLTEKLISDDKVDFALPPWGTGNERRCCADLQEAWLSAACDDLDRQWLGGARKAISHDVFLSC
jgi:branched-chain amino acid transport system substrate-binding protein